MIVAIDARTPSDPSIHPDVCSDRLELDGTAVAKQLCGDRCVLPTLGDEHVLVWRA